MADQEGDKVHDATLFILFFCRLDAIAADAELQEKSIAELTKLANLLHNGCERVIKEYQEKLESDPNFDGQFNLLAILFEIDLRYHTN